MCYTGRRAEAGARII